MRSKRLCFSWSEDSSAALFLTSILKIFLTPPSQSYVLIPPTGYPAVLSPGWSHITWPFSTIGRKLLVGSNNCCWYPFSNYKSSTAWPMRFYGSINCWSKGFWGQYLESAADQKRKSVCSSFLPSSFRTLSFKNMLAQIMQLVSSLLPSLCLMYSIQLLLSCVIITPI